MALDVGIDDPTVFQYRYDSDGTTFRATAVGDPKCNGRMRVYVLEGSIVDGEPRVASRELKWNEYEMTINVVDARDRARE